jgi:hypothetical protein
MYRRKDGGSDYKVGPFTDKTVAERFISQAAKTDYDLEVIEG